MVPVRHLGPGVAAPAGFGAKPGYGHDYSNAFVAGWAAVISADGWTSEDTVTLQALLAHG